MIEIFQKKKKKKKKFTQGVSYRTVLTYIDRKMRFEREKRRERRMTMTMTICMTIMKPFPKEVLRKG